MASIKATASRKSRRLTVLTRASPSRVHAGRSAKAASTAASSSVGTGRCYALPQPPSLPVSVGSLRSGQQVRDEVDQTPLFGRWSAMIFLDLNHHVRACHPMPGKGRVEQDHAGISILCGPLQAGRAEVALRRLARLNRGEHKNVAEPVVAGPPGLRWQARIAVGHRAIVEGFERQVRDLVAKPIQDMEDRQRLRGGSIVATPDDLLDDKRRCALAAISDRAAS